MKHFLKYGSGVFLAAILLSSCGRPFGKMQTLSRDSVHFSPALEFDKVLYRCSVDGKKPFGKKYHLSGILIIKKMPDSSSRVVFQNEMGFSFFDFKWSTSGAFSVVSIAAQMNKKPLIKLLKKDFELMLEKNLDSNKRHFFRAEEEDEFVCPKPVYEVHRYQLSKGFADYYYRHYQENKLVRIENFGTKKVATFQLTPTSSGALPSHATIVHHRANFTITINKLEDQIDGSDQ